MNYKVDPGLYALGQPGSNSPVLVTANYKMTFDTLRGALPNYDAWILVLDTKGINVWCAAGKGTFGTEELVRRIEYTGLAGIVSHRTLILPQLGAPGVAAHEVKKQSGFKVVYGPVRAADIPAFLDAGLEAIPEMRRVTFKLWERTVLAPMELAMSRKWFAIILPVFFVLGGLGGPEGFKAGILNSGLFAVYALVGALIAGAVLTPILLPWLPGRAFTLKGLTMGLIVAAVLMVFRAGDTSGSSGALEIIAWFCLIPAIAAFMAMNFTGASTYTSLSGVLREMKWAVPLEITVAIAGVALWLGSRITA